MSFIAFAQQNNQLGLTADVLNLKSSDFIELSYKRSISQDWQMRSFVSLAAKTNKEVRMDSLLQATGSVSYNLALGAQRMADISGHKQWNVYLATDGYWNSEFRKEEMQTYYGYYYTVGIRPAYGVQYKLAANLNAAFEARSNFNANLQGYSGEGENYDRIYSFKALDQLALSLLYCF